MNSALLCFYDFQDPRLSNVGVNRSLFQYISIIKISLLPQNQPANSFDFVFFPNHSNINMLKINGNSIFGLISGLLLTNSIFRVLDMIFFS